MKYYMPSDLWIATENKDVILKGPHHALLPTYK